MNILKRLQAEGNPLIEGTWVTFYWQGDGQPYIIHDLNDWEEEATALERLPAKLVPGAKKPLWSASLELPRDAYFEYAFFDRGTGQRMPDPFNPRTVNNGFGARNHYIYMPEAASTPLAVRRSDIRHGTVTRHLVQTAYLAADGRREVHLYRPAFRGQVPLLAVYDGTDYLRRGKLVHIVDNLIAEKRIRPIAMAMLQNAGRRREVEYTCSDAVIHWLDTVILPFAREHLNLLDLRRSPSAYGVLGASAGGMMSVYTGLRMPEVFGRVLCQSGVFGLDGRDFSNTDLIRHGQGRELLDIWTDIGRLDSLLEDNRRMQPVFKEMGYRVTYRESSGGHNYTSWRNEVWRGLEELFAV